MLSGCSWDCCSIILLWGLCVFIVPRPTPVSVSQSRPLRSKPDSGTFWGFFALQALNLLMYIDSWIFTQEIKTGRFSKAYIGDLWWSCGTGLLPCDGRRMSVWLGYLALTPALWHHWHTHKKGDFSTFLRRAAALCLLRRGRGRVQPPSLQKC